MIIKTFSGEINVPKSQFFIAYVCLIKVLLFKPWFKVSRTPQVILINKNIIMKAKFELKIYLVLGLVEEIYVNIDASLQSYNALSGSELNLTINRVNRDWRENLSPFCLLLLVFFSSL